MPLKGLKQPLRRLKQEVIMVITKTSMISGLIHSMDIDVTEEQLTRWREGALIQDALGHLHIAEREFIMTGITAEEWENINEK
jgi:hypothetical protein